VQSRGWMTRQPAQRSALALASEEVCEHYDGDPPDGQSSQAEKTDVKEFQGEQHPVILCANKCEYPGSDGKNNQRPADARHHARNETIFAPHKQLDAERRYGGDGEHNG
jgi:hypothetical protein